MSIDAEVARLRAQLDALTNPGPTKDGWPVGEEEPLRADLPDPMAEERARAAAYNALPERKGSRVL